MPPTLILGQLTLGVQCGQREQFQTLCKGMKLLIHQIIRLPVCLFLILLSISPSSSF